MRNNLTTKSIDILSKVSTIIQEDTSIDLKLNKMVKRIEDLQEARAKMFLPKSANITPEMANDYERLDESIRFFSRKSQKMIFRGVNQFCLGKYKFKVPSHKFVKRKWKLGKYYLPKSKLKIIYLPVSSFLNKLVFQESCGWRVNIFSGYMSGITIWITVYLDNTNIREVRYVDEYGKEINIWEKLFGL